MRCPHCDGRLFEKSYKKVKMRTSILVFSDDGSKCVTNCPTCKKEISVPIVLEKGAIPADPILFIDKVRLSPPPKQK